MQQCAHGEGYIISFIFLAGIAVSYAYYRTIICIYCPFRSDRWQLFLNLMLGAFTVCSRMAFGGDNRWQSNQILMFLNIIMSTVMVLMLGTYQRQFIWIYIFSMGANMSNIWCHFVFREYWFCVCGLVQAFLYRVQGHGHITLQSMCNVWIDEMKYGGYWNFVVLNFFFLLCFKESSVAVRSGKRQANRFDTWAFVTETTVIRRGKFLFQSVLLLLGD